MRVRESGMPPSETWEAFFDPEAILDALGVTAPCGDVVEFGCGYGTFTLPAAARTTGVVHAIDIDEAMTSLVTRRARAAGVRNVRTVVRDFVSDGTGLPDASVDFAMLFNILHHETPLVLLREAFRVLRNGGRLGIIHWNPDPATPRGPPMAMRPSPEDCRRWAEEAGFVATGEILALPPHHYGLVLLKETTSCA